MLWIPPTLAVKCLLFVLEKPHTIYQETNHLKIWEEFLTSSLCGKCQNLSICRNSTSIQHLFLRFMQWIPPCLLNVYYSYWKNHLQSIRKPTISKYERNFSPPVYVENAKISVYVETPHLFNIFLRMCLNLGVSKIFWSFHFF